MAHILITSGPTRQYLDAVRYLSNASSGRMGAALATAAVRRRHRVTVISGPVAVEYPSTCQVIPVTTTDEMMEAAWSVFPSCDGVIGAAAPCDYQPEVVLAHKMSKTGEPILVKLVETKDIVATLGHHKQHQWIVGFALESDDHHFRAITKMEKKLCDLIVLNHPTAMDSAENAVEVLGPAGQVLLRTHGPKSDVAEALYDLIERTLIQPRNHV